MAEEKRSYAKELTKGFLKENPVLRLVLGTCPTLATTTSVINGLGMGIAATIVLICSNVVISAMRKIIPEKARIPAYIVIIASFVTMVQMLVKAFVPALDKSLGVFLPLIVVNCIILGRAEAFASKNPVLASAVDGLGMGIGFTAALFCMGTVREILGAGTFLSGIDTLLGAYIDLGSFKGFDFSEGLAAIGLAPMTIFILPAGGFFVFGMLMALANKLAEKKGLKSATLNGCQGCPHASFCTKLNGNENAECAEKIEDEKKSDSAKNDEKIKKSSEEKKSAETKEEAEEVKKEKTAEAADEKPEEAPEAKAEEVSEEKTEEVSEEKTEEATEEKTEETTETKAEKATEEKAEEAAEEKADDEAAKEDAPTSEHTESPSEKQTDSPSSQNKKNKSKKKNKKAQQKAAIKEAFDTPIPETIPDFLKAKENDKKEDNE